VGWIKDQSQEPQVALSDLRPWGLSQWRGAVETNHLFLSYFRNIQRRRREQAVQRDVKWSQLDDKMSGSHFALVGQALRAFEAIERWRRSPRAQGG
jgi:hypothetical protein